MARRKRSSLLYLNRGCEHCPLDGCYQVDGDGTGRNGLMFLGEAPGPEEHECGVPFVGVVGDTFNDELDRQRIRREDSYVYNALRCFPQDEFGKIRKPTDNEITACSLHVENAIDIVKPKVIVAMGNPAVKSLFFDEKPGITLLRGTLHVYRDKPIWVVPTFHPSFPRRMEYVTKTPLRQFRQDLKFAKKLLDVRPPKIPSKITIANTKQKAVAGLKKVLRGLETAVDVEGYRDFVLSVAFTFNGGSEAIVIPVRHSESDLCGKAAGRRLPREVAELIRKILTTMRIIGQSFNFYDRPMVEREFDCRVEKLIWDTMYGSYIKDSRTGIHGLSTIASRFVALGSYDWQLEKYLLEHDLTKSQMDQVPLDLLGKYNGQDSVVTHLIANRQRELMTPAHKRLAVLTTRVSEAYEEMPRIGVGFDMEYSKKLRKQYQRKLADLERKIRFEAGDPDLNVNAPQQLGDVLFEDLRLHKKAGTAFRSEVDIQTPGGQWSTRDEVLQRLSEEVDHPILEMVQEHRDAAKDNGTFVEGLQKLVGSDDRLHAPILLHATGTGRSASRLHNIKKQYIELPLRKGEKERRRKYILLDQIVAPPGWVIVKADFSQVEMRVMAEMSEDPELMQLYLDGKDFHHETAQWLFNLEPGVKETEDERTLSKNTNFGTAYGLDAPGLYEYLRSKIPNFAYSRDKVADFWHQYYRRFKRLRQWQKEVIDGAYRDGFVTGLFGRTRKLDMSLGKHAENQAINTPIQGSAHDLVMLAILQLWEARQTYKIVFEQHDAAFLEVRESRFKKEMPIIEDCMLDLDTERWLGREVQVPITVDFSVAGTWGDLLVK